MSVIKRNNVLAHFKNLFQPNTIEAALAIASYLHRGVKDKGGVPYICHPLWIYSKLSAKCEPLEVLNTSILHDVYEDTEVTLTELAEWFSPTVCDAVDALSRREGEDRADYIRRVAKDPIARKVKKEDLRHNLDITRLKNRHNMSEKDLARIKCYGAEYDLLVGGAVGI